MGQAQGTDGRLLAGRYRLGGVLGKGGMGTVWRGVDETLGRTVAVKELRFPHNIDEDEKRRLITRTLREAKATALIRDTGAVTVFDVVEEDDRPWIVMELVEGRSLSDAIREDGPLTPKRAAEVGLTVLNVLKAAHKEGILHRDVKPSNVLIANDGRVVLSDFGIAQIDGDPSVTSTGMLVGAPSYISPERARGQKPGPPADLWSLGALLYASVEGRPPYDRGSAIATLTAVMTEQPKAPVNAGPLTEAIHGLLVKDPARRLDDTAVRPMLTEIANAPEAPVAPAPDVTRAMPLPADPQPTPTDAPAATRESSADQTKIRSALSSVRAARPKSKPKPDPAPAAPGAVPPAAPAAGQSRKRVAVIAAIAIALAILGTSIGFVLANADDGKSKKTGSGSKASASQSATKSASPSAGAGASGSSGTGSKSGSGSSSDATGSSGSGSGSGNSGSDSSVPSGFTVVTNSAFHFSMAMPDGWKQTGTAGASSGVIYSAGGGFPRVQVDFSSTPGKDAAAAWRAAEPGVRSNSTAYTLISIKKISFNGYRTAADWEFLRTQEGTKVHVVNRGFVTDDTHAYSIMFSAPAGDWNTAKVEKMRDTFYKTFKPAK